jgi:uncharacterized protein (DUF58 family)
MKKNELLKKVKQIEIKARKNVEELLSGNYHSVFKGKGIEFETVKEYHYGDDVKNIDWNVTARSDKTYIKTYTEERELTVIIVIDISASQGFGTNGKTKKDICLEVSAILSFSAMKNKDKVGLLIFSDRIELFIPPRNSKNHILRIIREVANERPTNKETDINLAIEYLNRAIKRKAIIFFLSDFISEIDYTKSLKVAGSKHDFIGIKINDPMENQIPPVGLLRVIDSETGEENIIDTSDKKAMRKFRKSQKREIELLSKMFRSIDIDFVYFNTTDDYLKSLIRFFKMRKRRR